MLFSAVVFSFLLLKFYSGNQNKTETLLLEIIKYLDSLNQERINFIIKGSFVNFNEKKIRRWIDCRK